MKIIPLGVWGGYPKANGANSSFLLEIEGSSYLIDCGSGVLASLQNYISIENLVGVIISHYHADHIADIGTLQYAMLVQSQLGKRNGSLPIYGHTVDKQSFNQLAYKNYTQKVEITETTKLPLNAGLVTFCATKHPAYCLAIKVQYGEYSVVFTADSEWTDNLVSFAEGATLLISEANLYEEQKGKIQGHMTGSDAGLLAKMAGVKQLLLTHLPHYGDTSEILQAAKDNFAGPVSFAEVGKKYELL